MAYDNDRKQKAQAVHAAKSNLKKRSSSLHADGQVLDKRERDKTRLECQMQGKMRDKGLNTTSEESFIITANVLIVVSKDGTGYLQGPQSYKESITDRKLTNG